MCHLITKDNERGEEIWSKLSNFAELYYKPARFLMEDDEGKINLTSSFVKKQKYYRFHKWFMPSPTSTEPNNEAILATFFFMFCSNFF